MVNQLNCAGEQSWHGVINTVREQNTIINVAAILVLFCGNVCVPIWNTATENISTSRNRDFVRCHSPFINLRANFILIENLVRNFQKKRTKTLFSATRSPFFRAHLCGGSPLSLFSSRFFASENRRPSS